MMNNLESMRVRGGGWRGPDVLAFATPDDIILNSSDDLLILQSE